MNMKSLISYHLTSGLIANQKNLNASENPNKIGHDWTARRERTDQDVKHVVDVEQATIAVMTMCGAWSSPIPTLDSSAKNPLLWQGIIDCAHLQVQGINTLQLSCQYKA